MNPAEWQSHKTWSSGFSAVFLTGAKKQHELFAYSRACGSEELLKRRALFGPTKINLGGGLVGFAGVLGRELSDRPGRPLTQQDCGDKAAYDSENQCDP